MLEIYPHSTKKKLTPKNDVLLVTGDGMSLPDDLNKFMAFKVNHDIMSIGRSINYYPGDVTHWVNVDGSESKHWVESLKGSPITHSMGDLPWYDVDWAIRGSEISPDDTVWHGSSALFATYIGLSMGYKRIVLAGCPLDKNGHWYFADLGDENTGPMWDDQSYNAWLEFAEDPRSDKVRSLSGFTADVLGMPDTDFFNA